MTDIVERLQYYTPYGPITDMQADAIMKEAADEIERLRAALSAVTELFKATEASAQFALSEVERLRAALRGIACTDDTCECGYVKGEGPFCELGRARAALGEKE